MTTKSSRAALVVLLLLATAAYARALRGEFQFDDVSEIERQAAVKHLDVSSLPGAWLRGGRPVANATFALNYAAGRLDPLGFHAVNVAIHLAAAALAWALARRVARLAGAARPEWLAIGVAGAFALHPIQTEAVSYLSQRSESLASALYLASLLLLLEAERLGRTPRGAAALAGALGAFVLALGTKPIAVTMPAAYLLVAAAVAGTPAALRELGGWPRRALLVLPFAAAALVHGRGTTASLTGPDAGFHVPGVSPWEYLLTQARAVVVYLRLLVWPGGQSVDWQFPISRSLAEPAVLLGGAFLVALLGAGVALLLAGRRSEGERGGAARLASLGILWFFLVLSVTSSVVPLADALVEHRLYLASWGIFLALAAAAERLTAPLGASGTRAAAATLVALMGLLAALTWRRNAVWESREALWRDVVEKAPDNARARVSLGYGLAEQGRHPEAIAQYEAALPFTRGHVATEVRLFQNLASSYLFLGRRDAALVALRRGLAVAPDDQDLLVNLGMALMSSGDPAGAEAPIRRAIELAPAHAVAWNALAGILLGRRDYAAALGALDRAAALNPDFGEIQLNRAMALDELGRTADACAALRAALAGRLMPRDRQTAERLVAEACR